MTILYVDDDADDRDIFCDIVKEMDPSIKVKTASDGVEALKILDKPSTRLPDIIVLDMNMPSLNGLQTFEELRKNPRLKNISVVIYTTGLRSEMQSECDKFKILCVNKGSTLLETRTAIRTILEAAK